MDKSEIFDCWKQIDIWLSDNSHEIFNYLNKPASVVKIKELEFLVSKKLPKDFYSVYRVHNGLSSDCYAAFFFGLSFYSVEQIICQLTDLDFNHFIEGMELKYCDSSIKGFYSEKSQIIPIGDDGASCNICIDLEPSETGNVGQVIFIDFKSGVAIKLADSMSELFSKFAVDLESGRYSLAEDALDEGFESLEPCSELDVVNWFHSPSWSYIDA